jgi:hypothetical protein
MKQRPIHDSKSAQLSGGSPQGFWSRSLGLQASCSSPSLTRVQMTAALQQEAQPGRRRSVIDLLRVRRTGQPTCQVTGYDPGCFSPANPDIE